MIGLTTHNGPLGSNPNGSIIPMGPSIAKACAAIIADRPKAFLREAKAFASTQRPGSFERLRELLGQYRSDEVMRWGRGGRRHARILIIAEILKIKASRTEMSAPLSMAAE